MFSGVSDERQGDQRSPVSSLSPTERFKTVELIGRTFDLNDPNGLYNFGKYSRFGGKPTKSQTIGKQVDGVEITIVGDPNFFVDPESNYVPGLVAGTLSGENLDEPIHLAIAVHGVFRVLTRSYFIDGERKFSALLPEEALRPGKNRVEIYLVSEDSAGAVSFLPVSYHAKVSRSPEKLSHP